MAITLPKVQQFEAQAAPVESGRLDLNLPNAEGIVQPIASAGENLVKTAQVFIKNEIDSSATEFANKSVLELKSEFEQGFETGYSPEDTGLRYKTGEQAFKDGLPALQARIQEKYNSILADPNTSDFVKSKAKVKLDSAMADIETRLTTWEGKAKEDYRATLTQANIDDRVRSLITIAGPSFDPARPETRALIDKQIFEIQDLIEEEAKARGQLITDENGNVALSRVYEIKLEKTLSKALQETVQNMAYTPGQTEKAKAMYETYKELIDGFGQERTQKVINQLSLEEKATTKAQDYLSAGMSYDEVQDQMVKEKLNPEERKEVLKEFARQTRERQSLVENQSKQMYELVYSDLEANKYKSVDDLKKANRAAWDQLQPRQRDALKRMIERPKESDMEVLNNVFNKYQDGTLFELSQAEFAEEAVGLNMTHFNMFLRARVANANPDKAARETETRRRVYVKDLLTNELIKQRVLPKEGARTAQQRELRDRYAANLMNELQDLGNDIPAPTQGMDLVKSSVERTKAGQTYKRKVQEAVPQVRPRGGGVTRPTPSGATGPFLQSKATPEQIRARLKLRAQGKLTFNGPDDTFERVNIYLKEGK